jgi:hypothetical protein
LGGAIEAAPAPDGSLYFMSLEPDGLVLRHLREAPATTAERTRSDAALVPALPPDPAKPVVFGAQSLAPSRPYGIGRQERSWFFGGRWTAYDKANEIGLRLGDVVGRLDSLAVYSTGGDAALVSTWRGWPVAVTGHAYRLQNASGIEVRAEYERHSPLSSWSLTAGSGEEPFAMGAFALRQRKTSQTIRFAADADDHVRGSLALSFDAGDAQITLTGEAGRNIAVGGYASSAVPDSLLIGRVLDPALPEGFVARDSYRSWRADVAFSAVSFFWRRYEDLDVRGLEVALEMPPAPLLRSLELQLTAGAAKVSGLRGLKGWLALRWRP